MTITIVATVVLSMFAAFAVAMFYVEMQTRGIVAPGGRKPE
jgi:hypothetical protein